MPDSLPEGQPSHGKHLVLKFPKGRKIKKGTIYFHALQNYPMNLLFLSLQKYPQAGLHNHYISDQKLLLLTGFPWLLLRLSILLGIRMLTTMNLEIFKKGK